MMRAPVVSALLAAAVLLAGCTGISLDLTPRIRPLEEKTVEGRGEDKILLMEVAGFIGTQVFFGKRLPRINRPQIN